jgi:sulfur transfer complex TusBCD TusB component (DsrH family)
VKTLHVLRKRNDHLAEAEICSESSAGGKGHSVSVLLIQDAVLGHPAVPVPVYVNTRDLQARGVTSGLAGGGPRAIGGQGPHGPPHIIDYEEICRMIVEHDRIVVW